MSARRPAVWDFLVVGGGSAGIVAAKTAASLGASVQLIERDRPGGDCLWTGCVPSKSLIAAACRARTCDAPELGVTGTANADFTAVMEHIRQAIHTIEPIDTPAALEAAGITVLQGNARFTGPATLTTDKNSIRFRQAFIATGARPHIPDIAGLEAFVTSDSVWNLQELPKDLLVLGGGSIGCELGQAFARLGSRVTLIEASDRILPSENADAAAIVQRSLQRDGVKILSRCTIASIEGNTARLSGEAHGARVHFDTLLISIGRTARTADLDLARAGVEVDSRGRVTVDSSMRTTNRRIWAAGDVTPMPQFTHSAGAFASIAASNAILGLRRKARAAAVPRVTYTDPEVASVGVTEPRSGLHTQTITHDHVDRAVTDARTDGFSRLVLDKKNRIVGATIVSPRAGETIGELTLAVRLGLRTRDIAATVHPYPTFSDGVWNAAIKHTREQLDSAGVQRVLRLLRGLRRRWVR